MSSAMINAVMSQFRAVWPAWGAIEEILSSPSPQAPRCHERWMTLNSVVLYSAFSIGIPTVARRKLKQRHHMMITETRGYV